MGRRIETSVMEEVLSGPPQVSAMLKIAYGRLFRSARWARLVKVLGFSPRQCQVALLMAKGFTCQQIAGHLGITYGTAKAHRHAIYRRMGTSCTERASLKLFLLTSPELDLETETEV